MDLNRIFMKNAAPTKVGGQAVLEGLMMRGSRALAVAVREPSGDINLTVEPLPAPGKWKKWPIIRGVAAFVSSLVTGTNVLLYAAEVLEAAGGDAEKYEKDKLDLWIEKHFDEETASKLTVTVSVVLAIVLAVGGFILLPTWLISLLGKAGVANSFVLNLAEGVLRIAMFVAYIALIARMPDIRRTFEYHGAEHKTIHCYENGLELTPQNAQSFYTLHPRCGTSFMVFVMIISLLIFSFLGWPNLAVRLVSRLLLIPVIAGISYEVLQFTGRHNNACVKALSIPGIMLQKLTTREPSEDQLEVAIAAMNAVLPSHEDPELPVDYWVGRIKPDGTMEKDEAATQAYREKKQKAGKKN
jgi:uncharacterized protein YqhQ